jgi:glycosyltransferase involved in cell wall biosynthesis
MGCRILLYYDRIGLASKADFPLATVVLDPPRNALAKILALKAFMSRQPAGSPVPLMSGIQAALHASIAGPKGFHTLMHDTPSLFEAIGPGTPIWRTLRRRIADRTLAQGLGGGGKTIVTSEYLADETRRLYGGSVRIARMGGIPTDAHTPRIVHDQLRMLSVSRIEANKRIDWILRGLAELESAEVPLSRRIDWRLDVVGDGALAKDMERLSEALNLTSRVSFRGFITDNELVVLYREAHLFLMPARQGYGIPAIEALSRGIPVLLHRESGVSDILLDTPWAVVIENGESEFAPMLAQILETVIHAKHLEASPPILPTEAGWAETVARECGWVC